MGLVVFSGPLDTIGNTLNRRPVLDLIPEPFKLLEPIKQVTNKP